MPHTCRSLYGRGSAQLGSNPPVRVHCRERPLTAHPRRCRAPREGSLTEPTPAVQSCRANGSSCPEADLEAERSARSRTSAGFLPEKLFENAPCRDLDKRLRLPVCQDDHAYLGVWSQHDRSAETRILAVVINQVHAVYVGGEPAERIVQVLGRGGGRQSTPTAVSGRCSSAIICAETTRRPDIVPSPSWNSAYRAMSATFASMPPTGPKGPRYWRRLHGTGT
jgi:hypothetical protein